MDWGQILGGLGQLGSVGGVFIFIVMYRQMTQHVLKAYQVVVQDMGNQLQSLRTEIQDLKDQHASELDRVHASHVREFTLSEAHRTQCERRLEELERVLEVMRGRRSTD